MDSDRFSAVLVSYSTTALVFQLEGLESKPLFSSTLSLNQKGSMQVQWCVGLVKKNTTHDLLPSCSLLPQRSKSSGKNLKQEYCFATASFYDFVETCIFVWGRHIQKEKYMTCKFMRNDIQCCIKMKTIRVQKQLLA